MNVDKLGPAEYYFYQCCLYTKSMNVDKLGPAEYYFYQCCLYTKSMNVKKLGPVSSKQEYYFPYEVHKKE